MKLLWDLWDVYRNRKLEVGQREKYRFHRASA